MKTYLSPFKPWEKLKITKKTYLKAKPWKKAEMTREKFEKFIMELSQDFIDERRIDREAEMLLASIFGMESDG